MVIPMTYSDIAGILENYSAGAEIIAYLVDADKEMVGHFTVGEILVQVRHHSPGHLIIPTPNGPYAIVGMILRESGPKCVLVPWNA
jgi:hypothetical protein